MTCWTNSCLADTPTISKEEAFSILGKEPSKGRVEKYFILSNESGWILQNLYREERIFQKLKECEIYEMKIDQIAKEEALPPQPPKEPEVNFFQQPWVITTMVIGAAIIGYRVHK